MTVADARRDLAGTCPGPCNREYREAMRATNGHTSITPRWGAPIWCPACTSRIRHALHDLVELYVWLELDKANIAQAPPDQDRVKVGEHQVSPSPQGDWQDEQVRWLCDWCDAIAELRDQPERVWLGREPERLAAAVNYLHVHLGWALEHDSIGLDIGQEITQRRSVLRRLTGVGMGPRHCPAPCSRCDMRTLFQHHDGGRVWVQCHACDRIMTTDEYQDWVGHIAGHVDNPRAS